MIKYLCPDEGMNEQLIRLWQEAFGDSREFAELYMGSAYSPSHCRCATEDGELLAVLHIMDCTVHGKLYAYVYAAATAENARGRGIFRGLIADTEEYLKKNGYSGMVLSAGDDGLIAMYEKLGFSRISGLAPVEAKADGGKITGLKRLNAEEYVRERKKHLPEGAVFPSEAMTAFLDKYAHLYVGDGFAFAAVTEGDSFTAAEFLGDEMKLSDVLRTLDYAEGTFYVPRESSRAMHRAFDDSLPPSLLGIAFNV